MKVGVPVTTTLYITDCDDYEKEKFAPTFNFSNSYATESIQDLDEGIIQDFEKKLPDIQEGYNVSLISLGTSSRKILPTLWKSFFTTCLRPVLHQESQSMTVRLASLQKNLFEDLLAHEEISIDQDPTLETAYAKSVTSIEKLNKLLSKIKGISLGYGIAMIFSLCFNHKETGDTVNSKVILADFGKATRMFINGVGLGGKYSLFLYDAVHGNCSTQIIAANDRDTIELRSERPFSQLDFEKFVTSYAEEDDDYEDEHDSMEKNADEFEILRAISDYETFPVVNVDIALIHLLHRYKSHIKSLAERSNKLKSAAFDRLKLVEQKKELLEKILKLKKRASKIGPSAEPESINFGYDEKETGGHSSYYQTQVKQNSRTYSTPSTQQNSLQTQETVVTESEREKFEKRIQELETEKDQLKNENQTNQNYNQELRQKLDRMAKRQEEIAKDIDEFKVEWDNLNFKKLKITPAEYSEVLQLVRNYLSTTQSKLERQVCAHKLKAALVTERYKVVRQQMEKK